MDVNALEYEYVLQTDDDRAELFPALQNIARQLDHFLDVHSKEYFAFEWTVGILVVRVSEIERNANFDLLGGDDSSNFEDDPQYRVLAGTNARLLRKFVDDMLKKPHAEISKIRSIVFAGRQHEEGALIDIERLLVVEGNLSIIDTLHIVLNPSHPLFPMEDWDNVRIIETPVPVQVPGIKDLVPLLHFIWQLICSGQFTLLYESFCKLINAILFPLIPGCRLTGKLSGFAHMTVERSHFVITHQIYPDERILSYTFIR